MIGDAPTRRRRRPLEPSAVKDSRREPPGDKLAPKAVVDRVCLYLRQLEAFQRQGETTVSSSQLGAALGINDAQVRKDLAFFGQFGYPGIGYRIEGLIASLRRSWGSTATGRRPDRPGQPRPGPAEVRGFPPPGVPDRRALRQRPHKLGQKVDGLIVQPIDKLPEVAASRAIRLADPLGPGRGRPGRGRSDRGLRHPGHPQLRPDRRWSSRRR